MKVRYFKCRPRYHPCRIAIGQIVRVTTGVTSVARVSPHFRFAFAPCALPAPTVGVSMQPIEFARFFGCEPDEATDLAARFFSTPPLDTPPETP